MSTIVTRSGKGSPLTHVEVDANFTNLNTDKYQSGDAVTFTTLTATGQTSLGGAAGSESLRVNSVAGATRWMEINGSVSSNILTYAKGASGNPGFGWATSGTGSHDFGTNASVANLQFRVSHTASAVNYVQVTGAATTVAPVVSAQGSDTNVGLTFNTKGTGSFLVQTSGTTRLQVTSGGVVNMGFVNSTAALQVTGVASQVNSVLVSGSAAGAAPSISVGGTDTNIDLTLTPKGTGVVQFGSYTASVLTPTGYITIKDSGGTTRRLLVG